MSLDLSLNFPDINFGMEKGGKNGVYEFDRFRLDPEKLMLYRDGVEVSMPPKMVKTLLVLVEDRGTIISKDDLIDRVWPDAIVDESNLSQHLYHLRKTLGVRPTGRPYIETFRRRGYRFNGDVIRVNSSPAVSLPPPAAPSTLVSAATPATQTSVQRTGNVLRLEDWKPAPDRAPRIVRAEAETRAELELQSEGSALPKRTSFRLKLAVSLALLFTVAIVAISISQRMNLDARPAAALAELSLLRLTNGIKPVEVAISPNGDHFVYHELADKGEKLWVQQVGQASRVEIASTSSRFHGAKTFSHDGKFIYFIATEEGQPTGALYKVPTFGGPQTKILDHLSRPVSFSPDGREMVFIRDNQQTGSSSLLIAGSDGSNVKTLLEYRSPTQLVGSPAWSPDGSIIVFAAVRLAPSDSTNKVDLYSVGISGGKPTRIGNERWDIIYRIVWTGDGRGIVMIGTRADETYTTRRDQVFYLSYSKGESRRLTTDGSRHQEWSLGVTKDDAIIAAAYNRSSQIWAMNRSGDVSTAFQISRGSGDGRAGLVTMPDGRVGFIARSGEEIDIWTMNSDGSDLKQLTSGITAIEELRADPRGRYLVFSRSKDKQNHLFRIDADGNNLRQLTFGEGHEIDSTVSADGNWVVFGPAQADTKQVLYRIFIDGGQPAPFGDAICRTPNFSPDGDMLSCVRDGEILVLSGADGKLVKTFSIPPYAAVHFGARWTPDGRNLLYIRNEKGFSNLWLQPLDGASPRPLTNFSVGDIYNYSYSHDGTRLFVARGQQISDAILIRNYR